MKNVSRIIGYRIPTVSPQQQLDELVEFYNNCDMKPYTAQLLREMDACLSAIKSLIKAFPELEERVILRVFSFTLPPREGEINQADFQNIIIKSEN